MSWKSDYKCPSCQTPLSKANGMGDEPLVVLWCGYGPCVSSTCTDGASGDTEKEAYEKIVHAYGEEVE